MTPDHIEVVSTQYGFDYGQARVERLFSDDRFGIVIRVASCQYPDRWVDVRVSPAGRKVEVTP